MLLLLRCWWSCFLIVSKWKTWWKAAHIIALYFSYCEVKWQTRFILTKWKIWSEEIMCWRQSEWFCDVTINCSYRLITQVFWGKCCKIRSSLYFWNRYLHEFCAVFTVSLVTSYYSVKFESLTECVRTAEQAERCRLWIIQSVQGNDTSVVVYCSVNTLVRMEWRCLRWVYSAIHV